MFTGSIPAIITPFKNGDVDYKAFENLIEFHIAAGSHGLVVCGTTGESPTLNHDEQVTIVKRCVDVVKGRIPVIAGTGSNSTAKTVDMTRTAHELGADAALIVAPYYNKPTQEGLFQHYRTVAEAVNIPVIVYNIPGRACVDISNETLVRLSKISNIIGVKDATGDLARPLDLIQKAGKNFIQLSGEDATALALLQDGGHGCISVTANVAPAQCAALHNAWQAGNETEAENIFNNLIPLHKALFTETNPIPVKYALSTLGLCTDEVRLPLVPASPACRKVVDTAIKASGIGVTAHERQAINV